MNIRKTLLLTLLIALVFSMPVQAKAKKKTVPKVRTITLSSSDIELAVGQKQKLKATVKPRKAKTKKVRWKSSNSNIAHVSSKGTVTAKAPGTATITAKCRGKKATCKVHVNIHGILTIIDDDGRLEYMDKFLPIVAEKGVSISIAVIPSNPDKESPLHMNWDQIAECHACGAEILCHSYSHNTLGAAELMTADELLADYAAGQNALIEHGYDANILVYPGSSGTLTQSQQAAAGLFDCAIHCNGGKINTDDMDPYYLRRYRADRYLRNQPGLLRSWINTVRRKGGWMIWIFHSKDEDLDETALKNLRSLIDYARSRGVEMVTAQEGFSRWSR